MANNAKSLNPWPINNTHGKSKFLEMDEQDHQVLHHYKPKLYNNNTDVKTYTEDDQQLKTHLSILSSDSVSSSSEPSLIDMHEDEVERFLRSMRILLNRREIMDEQLGYHPTRHISKSINNTSIQAMANGIPPVKLAFGQRYPQKIFAAPNMNIPVIDDAQSEIEQKQQPHPLLLQPTNDNDDAWDDVPTTIAYPDKQSASQSTCTISSNHMHSTNHSSIESLEMSEQL